MAASARRILLAAGVAAFVVGAAGSARAVPVAVWGDLEIRLDGQVVYQSGDSYLNEIGGYVDVELAPSASGVPGPSLVLGSSRIDLGSAPVVGCGGLDWCWEGFWDLSATLLASPSVVAPDAGGTYELTGLSLRIDAGTMSATDLLDPVDGSRVRDFAADPLVLDLAPVTFQPDPLELLLFDASLGPFPAWVVPVDVEADVPDFGTLTFQGHLVVPEPGAAGLLGLAALASGVILRRRRGA